MLSETLAPQHRAPFSWAKSNPFHALRAALRYRRFLLFSAPFCLSQLAECVYQFVVLYTQKRFGWGYVMLGFYVSATGIFLALVQVRPWALGRVFVCIRVVVGLRRFVGPSA